MINKFLLVAVFVFAADGRFIMGPAEDDPFADFVTTEPSLIAFTPDWSPLGYYGDGVHFGDYNGRCVDVLLFGHTEICDGPIGCLLERVSYYGVCVCRKWEDSMCPISVVPGTTPLDKGCACMGGGPK